MSLEKVKSLYPIPQTQYTPFLRQGVKPPLDAGRINSVFLTGAQRRPILKTLFTGDGSLAIYYKSIEGAIVSFGIEEDALSILQIQGARSSVSYRLATGLNLEAFLGGQIRRIACFLARDQQIERIVMPKFAEGIKEAASERVLEKYHAIALKAGLRNTGKESQFECKTKDLSSTCHKSCEACLPKI